MIKAISNLTNQNTMHTTDIQAPTPAGRPTIFSRTHSLMRRTLVLVLLALSSIGVKAADYVITYTSGGITYYIGMDGTTLVAKTAPDATCVWTCINRNNNNEATLSTTDRRRMRNKSNTNYFLNASVSRSGSWGNYRYTWNISASTTGSQYWYGTAGTDLYHTDNSYSQGNGYLHNSGSTISISTSTTNSFVPYAVTVTTVNGTYTGVAINGATTLTATGNSNYTTTSAAYRIGYTNFYYNSTNHYYDENGNSFTGTPSAATISYSWNLTSNNYATVSGTTTTGTVNVSALPESDITLTLSLTANVTGGNPAAPANTSYTDSKEITIQGTKPSAPTISVSGTNVTITSTAVGSTSIRYTLDGSTPTASSGTAYSGAFDISGSATSPVTIKAVTVRNGNASDVSTEVVTLTLPEPVITADGDAGTATISATAGATIYYTTDGSTPTTSSAQYTSAISGLSMMTTIKAIAVKDGWNDSPVASELVTITSSVSGGTVTLFDYEDHTWTYYSGIDASVDGGNYNTNYAGKMYSPNPRNVKITYNGVNGVANSKTTVKVSISDPETSFVYYKTLEQGSTSGEYPYQVISNPFSVRPSTGSGNSKVYYGFAGWKIVSGGEYIKNHNNNDVLSLDEEIVFNNLPYPSVNCTSAEIVFETTWTQATVANGSSISLTNLSSSGTYETNFFVLTGAYTTAWNGTKNVTVTSVYPDGSSDVRANNVYTYLNVTVSSGYTVKYEYININNNNTTCSLGTGTKTLYIGRGVSNTSANGVVCNLIQGYNNSINSGGLSYTLKIESGIYNNLSYIKGYEGSTTTNTVSGTVAVKSVLGCDYDRAKGDNSKLKIQSNIIMGYANSTNYKLLQSATAGQEVLNVTFKSGSLNSNLTSAGTADAAESFYIGIAGGYSPGYRIFNMEGGEMWSLAAGLCQNTATTNSIRFRIKGGLIKGSIYGSAANADSYGYKQMIITGGTIRGWIAGGGNGTSANGGVTTGSSYIYVGGNARVDSNGSNTKINSSLGGQVFGSGSGVENTTTWGEMLNGTNVVIADNAYIERNAFGGGNFGWTDQTANIYLTGQGMSVGNVYGGANQNKGEYVNIYMTGGTVREGLYGGSNTTGTISNNVKMVINGGQVGTSSNTANIHGGGYGSSTVVTGNVDITLGALGQTTPGVTVYGDVYGGSALGKVNGTSANTDYHTNVTLNKGTIYGSLYGGALGDNSTAANVYSPVLVTVNGGSVKKTSQDGSGAVYGCNNVNGAPQRSVAVVINGTDPAPSDDEFALYAVYGGGNQADYEYTTPTVTVNNCNNSIEYVFGGGNAASVPSTNVKIYGADSIANVFGGGNGISGVAADVDGQTVVNIYGGHIGKVFGGSNKTGTIGGTITVNVAKSNDCTDPMLISEVYGGGNMAPSSAGTINISCTGTDGYIDKVFGGANAAQINGHIDLKINGGNIGDVFGGNNASGDITGTVKVTVGNAPENCGVFKIKNVYGGGNLAPYGHSTNYPSVSIVSGTITEGVYGGGYGQTAVITGNPQVTVTGGTIGAVYGGGNAAAVTGNTVVSVSNATVTGSVYGGGNAAGISGTTSVTVSSGTIGTGIYGGCNAQGNVGSTATVNVSGGTIGTAQSHANIHGGGFGDATRVLGSVSVTLANTTVNGDVYGGSAEGKTNGDESRTSGAVTTVTMNSGTVTGSIYGGGLGTQTHAADVWGPVTLTINKGSTVGTNVYGGNNANGSPQVSIEVIVNGPTESEAASTPLVLNNVYGGGNEADVASGCTAPHVNIKGCGTVVTRAFGGGNAAEVPATNIEIHGGTFDYVFGGGNGEHGAQYGADVTGNVNLKIYGGTIKEVFAGSNANGTIGGSMNVTLDSESNNSCGIDIASLYGGGNKAVGKTGTFTINNCDAVIDTIYGGSKAAPVNGNIALEITKGQIGSVFGGNNMSGAINGTIAVTVNLDNCASLDNVFGGGNHAAYSGTPTVTLTNGTVNHSVFGGGNEAGVGGSLVNINGGRVMDGIYGGCNTSGTVTGNIQLNINGGTQGVQGTPMTNGIFGGGYGAGTSTNGNVTVNIGNGSNTPSIFADIYGGSALGSVNDAAADKTTINVLSGTVTGNIYGGGFGMANVYTGETLTTDNSAKGQVNGEVIVNIGATDGAQSPTYSGNATINGSVYGCNNTNGSPKANVTVNVYKTAHTDKNTATYTQNDATYAIQQVFGGGNQADYSPTSNDSRATLHVYTCANTIGRVFGGGNAAAAYGVVTTIDGGRFNYIFGGGNGENNHAANIGAGGTNLTVNSGVINYLFGGSNETGSINGPMLVAVNNTGGNDCTERIKNFFAGGNLANIGTAQNPVNLSTTIACGTNFDAVYGGSNLADIYGNVTLTINGGTIDEVYAGSKGVAAGDATYANGKAANIYGNTTLYIKGGDIGNAFGGSNINGNITGSITVDMDWSLAPNGCNNATDLHIDTIFGASNLATYDPTTPGDYPAVNIKHGTVSGSVFGAGNGLAGDPDKGVVTSNPVVTIGDANANHTAIVNGNVYGGGNNAAVSGSTQVIYNDNNANSTVAKLFGGGNAANVSGTTSVTLTSGKVTGGVYGGCNSSGSVGAVTVALNGGQVGATGAGNEASVYGGGYGHSTSTTGNIGVTLGNATVYGDIYGGSALGSVNASTSNTTTITIGGNALHGTIYGGGMGSGTGDATRAVSNGNVQINYNTANTGLTGLYGGANVNGQVAGNIELNVNANVGASGNGNSINIFGGGYGAATATGGNVNVTVGNATGSIVPVVYGDIYGGSALGNVNDAAADITTVNFLNGTLHGNLYGGGLGDAQNAAKVNGQVVVNISNTTQTAANCHIDLRDASIYGGNNTNGSPQDNITVNVYKTAYNYSDYASGDNYTAADGAHPYYAIDQVFGGGNQADYAPEDGLASSTKKTTVHIYGCDNTVRRVFGGGNAAAAVGLVTIIDGGRFDYVFGGGNGETSAANIGAGGTNLQVHGGNIRTLFGGSNTSGTITGQMRVNVDGTGACASDMYIAEFFCGNNKAPIGTQQSPTNINATIGCDTRFGDVYGGCNLADIWGDVTLTIVGGTMNNVYGGSKGDSISLNVGNESGHINKAANINGNVVLNIHGGNINNDAFGGSNINGNITGSITVNMDWSQASSDCNQPSDLHVDNVYGASNKAAYKPTNSSGLYPAVYINHGTVSHSVFGGGKGESAVVTSNPVVTIGDNNSNHYAIIGENVYGGGDAAAVTGNTSVTYNDSHASSTIAKLFGGGNAANVSGTTTVTLTNGKVTGGVYGGCNSTGSVGAVTVALNGGQVGATGNNNSADVYGGGYGSATTTTGNVSVTLGSTTVYGDIYGGSALGKVNSQSANPANLTTVTINGTNLHGSVFGGGKGDANTQAVSYGNATVNINAVNAYTGIYGGANVNGLVSGNIILNISANVGASGSGNNLDIFGGGYGALTSTNGSVTVNIGNGNNNPVIYGDIYGGSALGSVNDAEADYTTVNVLSGNITGNIYGGGLGQTGAANVTKGQVNGTVVVNIGTGTVNETTGFATSTSGAATINGSVFGCNNTNGSPQANVTVNIYQTAHTEKNTASYTGNDATYAINEVFGGGNLADYSPASGKAATVHIYTCNNTVNRVFGGGNAAAALGVATIIDGGRFNYIFGGGNGETDPADIGAGGTNLQIHGGNIKMLFGGSNTSGTITGDMRVNINASGSCGDDMYIDEFFCGNNLADIGTQGHTVNINATIGCGTNFGSVYGGCNLADIYGNVTLTILGGEMNTVYGGSKGRSATSDPSNSTPKAADIFGDVTLNLYGGEMENAFGGSNINGNIHGIITVNMIDLDGGSCGFSVNNVYGASNLATYSPTYTPANGNERISPIVNIIHGTVSKKAVTENGQTTYTGGNVYGGGKGGSATVTSSPRVNVGYDQTTMSGYLPATLPTGYSLPQTYQVTIAGDVYGGGDAAGVTGNTSVTIQKAGTTVGNAYGGGNAAAITGTTLLTMTDGTVGNLYGGGRAAGVSSTATVYMNGGSVSTGIYGGCNASGAISGAVAVYVNGGTVGTDATSTANVHGGGYGASTSTGSNVTVIIGNEASTSPTIWGDVYGGSALGNVNASTSNLTKVWLKKGTINGSLYGGGLGDANNPALVNGAVQVVVDGGEVKSTSNNQRTTGAVFGCNNVNGTPKGTVEVTINSTVASTGSGDNKVYALQAVYGGGNLAHFDPTTPGNYPTVTINGCGTSIKDVFGGGNAAAVPYTYVTINGGDIDRVFAGGNGESGTPANVGYKNTAATPTTDSYGTGTATVLITDGTINHVFAGSNANGTIRGGGNINVERGATNCGLYIGEIYGGGNLADGNAGTINIGCTGAQGEGIGDVYGGANQANVGNNITLNITGGSIQRVFGGNNTSGTISGTITVNVEWNSSNCYKYLGSVFGGGNLAEYSGSPVVNIKNGTVNGNVFGGGNGDPNDATQVKGSTGTPTVTIGDLTNNAYQAIVTGDVYGGGNAAKVTGNTSVTVQNANTTVGNAYGGGNAAPITGTTLLTMNGGTAGNLYGGGNAAGVGSTATVNMNGGTVTTGIYGGCNSTGNITGAVAVYINGGTIGSSSSAANIHGGGFGQNTTTSNNVEVTIGSAVGAQTYPTIYGDVYGGSALGKVNGTSVNTNLHTYVTMNAGTINGSLYGGALGNNSVPANVYAPVTVTVNSGTITGEVYGCNNVNGAPQSTVTVDINGTDMPQSGYALGKVFGGGNHAPYAGTPVVTVHNCDNSIEYVYGGGNAASVAGTDVTIYGGNEIGNVFGGCYGADVTTSGTLVKIYGGKIGKVFGGSNSSGTITGAISVTVNKTTETGHNSCNIDIAEVYGGGNMAASSAGTLNIGCADHIGSVYGGSNDANITGNILLNITSGHIDNVFGGNNTGHSITGTITVNIDDAQNSCGMEIGNVYGGGNMAAYTYAGNYPVVNIKKGTITGDVFGGGYGGTATVTANPQVVLTGGSITGRVFGGGALAPVSGNPTVTAQSGSTTTAARLYGGGLGSTAVVTGNTTVDVSGGTFGYVFGGGEAANQTGDVVVNIKGGTVTNDVYGGGALAHTNTAGSKTTTVNLTGGTMKNAYGGGLGDANTEALVYGNVAVNLNSGVAADSKGAVVTDYLFGCNNINGSPKGSVTVHVYATQNSATGSILVKNQDSFDMKGVYGGGNMAAYKPTTAATATNVIIEGCGLSSIEYVYGGGNAAPVPATVVDIYGSYQIGSVFGGGNGKDQITVNGVLTDNPGADVGIYKVDYATWNAAGNLKYTDNSPNHDKGDDYYILYGSTAGESIIGTTHVTFYGGNITHLFGGSNTKGDIVKEAKVILGDEDLKTCEFNVGDVYGGSNEAYMSGTSNIDMNCTDGMGQIYGGSRMADVHNDIVLTITGGHYQKVFGGNNLSGRIYGSITVNIEQTGCLPIEIDELYGGGNEAAYSVYGYDGNTPIEEGTRQWADPQINIKSFKSIGTVFGGGYGATADVIGNPTININTVEGWTNGDYQGKNTDPEHPDPHAEFVGVKKNLGGIGEIGTVFGGGNQAIVKGDTYINIGTQDQVTIHNVSKEVYNAIKDSRNAITTTGQTDITNPGFTDQDEDNVTKDLTITVEGVNITGNVYGGGNNADVTGSTHVIVGKEQQEVEPQQQGGGSPAPRRTEQEPAQNNNQQQPQQPQTNAATESQQTRSLNATRQ